MKFYAWFVAAVLSVIPFTGANAQFFTGSVGQILCADYTHLVPQGFTTRLASVRDLANRGYMNFGRGPFDSFRPPLTVAIGLPGTKSNNDYRKMVAALPYLNPRNNGPMVDEVRDVNNYQTIKDVKSWRQGTPDCIFVESPIRSEFMMRVDYFGASLEFVSIDDPAVYRIPGFSMQYIPPGIYPNLQSSRRSALNNSTSVSVLNAAF